jgi:hypothetical protein
MREFMVPSYEHRLASQYAQSIRQRLMSSVIDAPTQKIGLFADRSCILLALAELPKGRSFSVLSGFENLKAITY